MIKNRQIKITSIFLLVFTLSTGSQQLRSFAIVKDNLTSIVAQNNQNTPNQAIISSSPLQEANRKFSDSVDDFVKQLGKSPQQIHKNLSVNSDKVLSELQELESCISTLNFYIKNQDTKAKINNIESDIGLIQNILIRWRSKSNQDEYVINKTEQSRSKKVSNTIASSGNYAQIDLAKSQNDLLQKTQNLNQKIDELDTRIKDELEAFKTQAPISNENVEYNSNISRMILLFSNIFSLLIGLGIGVVGISLLIRKDIINYKKSQLNPNNNQDNILPQQSKYSTSPTTLNPEYNANVQPIGRDSQTEISSTSYRRQPTDIPPPPPITNNPGTHYTFTSSEQTIATIYNQNSKQVCKNATEVSETTDSIQQRRLGANNSVILERVSRGKGSYCVIPQQGFFYLVPKDNLKINEYNRETVTTLFESYNYQPGRSTDFRLKTPAVVIHETEDTWRLQTKGELDFS